MFRHNVWRSYHGHRDRNRTRPRACRDPRLGDSHPHPPAPVATPPLTRARRRGYALTMRAASCLDCSDVTGFCHSSMASWRLGEDADPSRLCLRAPPCHSHVLGGARFAQPQHAMVGCRWRGLSERPASGACPMPDGVWGCRLTRIADVASFADRGRYKHDALRGQVAPPNSVTGSAGHIVTAPDNIRVVGLVR